MIMDIEQVMQYLPHRYPFLLIDKVIELEPGKQAHYRAQERHHQRAILWRALSMFR